MADEYKTTDQSRTKLKTIEGTFEGLPYRGPVIHLKDTDDIAQVLKFNQRVHICRLDLGSPEGLQEYEKICQEVNDGRAQMSFEERMYVPERQQWVVLVRWIEQWFSPAEEKKP